MSCACGPDWLPEKWVHKYLKTGDEECFFHRACTIHDADVKAGNGYFHSNRVFLMNMMVDAQRAIECDKTHTPSYKQLKRALSYHRWVTWFGWISYIKWYILRQRN